MEDFHKEMAAIISKQLRALADQLDRAPMSLVGGNLHPGGGEGQPSTMTVTYIPAKQ